MPILNPPGAPTGNLATQDIYSISRYLNDPTFVYRALATIADQMFVGTKVLRGQFFTDDGSIIYEQIESIFANGNPQGVAPGSEYPLASIPTGPAQIATTVKWGLDTIITDESINRQRINVLEKAFIKLANSLVQQVDDVIMSTVQSAVTQQFNAGSATLTGDTPGGNGKSSWNGAGGNTPTIMRDVMYATQIIRGQKQGYSPDTVLCDLQTYAAVIGDPTIAPTLPREDMGSANVGEAPVLQGINSGLGTRLFGLNWLASPNLPSSPYVAVLDSKVFGAMVDERLPAPGYVGAQSGAAGDDEDGRSMIQVKTMREDDVDRWRIRARRVTTPIIIEPLAAVEIVGV